jgi:4-amino-4-deoxy-L-arabinose transferase-like glycosyltransferase
MLGVYLLAQVSFIVTFAALFALGRSLLGPQQAVIAVLLTLTINAFGFPGVEFGPDVLLRPLWALTLLHYWRAIGEGRRNAWFALSIEVGLLLLTSYAALMLVGLLVAFTLATRRGRQMLGLVDPWYSLIVIAALAFPHALWVVRNGGNGLFAPVPPLEVLWANLAGWPNLVGLLVLTLAGALLLVVLNIARFGDNADDVPVVIRPPLSAFARYFIVFFALAPFIVGSLLGAAQRFDHVVGGAGVALLLMGLLIVLIAGDIIYLRRQRVLRLVWAVLIAAPAIAIVGVSLLLPWTAAASVKTSQPAAEIGRFFGDSFERRTGQRLPAVAGDPDLALLIALTAPGRPHLLLDASPQRTPWQSPERFSETGGIVVWRAQDTAGAPPADIRRRFPNLVPEVPRAFERFNQGREPLPRIGWAIVRPRGG